jgi:hypothetical protein
MMELAWQVLAFPGEGLLGQCLMSCAGFFLDNMTSYENEKGGIRSHRLIDTLLS